MTELRLTPIRCAYDPFEIKDLVAAVAAEFQGCQNIFSDLPAGGRIALTVGSRGITNIARIVKAAAAELRQRGFRPFIIPAMGSHGGATAPGQASILADYGITEDTMGVPIVSSMDTVELPAAPDGTRVFMSRDAWNADGVVLINRIKAHTDFHGDYESGLMKMAVIGLGKHAQALEIHSYGIQGLRERIGPVAAAVLGTGKILAGLGIVENAYDKTCVLRLIPQALIPSSEKELLAISKNKMPRLPADDLDLLIIDEMGKNISGVGMDPNIIGRMRVRDQEEPTYPRISSILVCSLTPESHGNALGVGLADVTLRSLFDSIDYGATMANGITSGFLDRAKIPLMAEHARQGVEIALRSAPVRDWTKARIIRIRNTLRLDEILVSEALLPELKAQSTVEVLGAAQDAFEGTSLSPLRFDAHGGGAAPGGPAHGGGR